MTKLIGILLILYSIDLGIQAKRDMRREINRWTLVEVASSVGGFVCGVCIFFGIIDIPRFLGRG